MDWRRLGIAWAVVAFALVVCAGAVLNTRLAWRLGYAGTAIPYLGSQIGGFILTLLAAGAVVTAFEYAMAKDAVPLSKLQMLFVVLVMLGCTGPVGLYAAWPVAAAVPVCAFGALLISRRKSLRNEWLVVALCPAVVILLFVLTWVQSARVFPQALRGLGERIEEKCGADRLAAWAAEMVAAHPTGAILDPNELPEFVRDLSPRPEVPVHAQVIQQPDRYVQLYIGTGHAFTVAVHPSQVRPGAAEPVSDHEWRPGIVLGTMGK